LGLDKSLLINRMASRGRGGMPYPRQVQASREAAYFARVAHLGQFPGNVSGARAAAAGAARGAFYETLAELTEALDATCPALERDEKDFLALALSQLTPEELAALPQTGGSRIQRGGAIGEALRRFIVALCDRGRRAVTATEADAAASVDLTSRGVTALSQGELFSGILTAAAGSTVILGNTRGMAALALTAVRALNSIIPGPVTVAVNTFSGLAAWLPVGVALTPVVGKLFTIALCLKAFQLTREFVREQGGIAIRDLRNFNQEQFLRALLNYVYRGLERNAVPVAASASSTAIAAASSIRNTVAALFSRAPPAPPAVAQGIDAAVQVLIEDASVQAAISAAVIGANATNATTAANAGAAGGRNAANATNAANAAAAGGRNDANAGAGGGNTGATLTEAEVANVVANLGEAAEEASQAAGSASANPSQNYGNRNSVDYPGYGAEYVPEAKRPRPNRGTRRQEGGKRFKNTRKAKKSKKARKSKITRKSRKPTRKNR
jgi:hypothetical protein